MKKRVRVVPDLNNRDEERFAAHVVIRTRDREWSRSVVHGRGHPANPMTTDQRLSKQHRALDPVLGEESAAAVIEALHRLPEINDLTWLQAIADPSGPPGASTGRG